MSDRIITAIGLALGAALVGISLGAYAARKWRGSEPADTYNQAAASTAVQAGLRGARG